MTSPSLGRYDEQSMADPSIPPSDEICHFFRLPRELRDEIYEYALSEPGGLFYRFESSDTAVKPFRMFTSLEAAQDDAAIEANQLQYVCRQLYKETTGLGVKFNDLNFVRFGTAHPPPLEQLLGFIEGCSPQRLCQLRKIKCRRIIGTPTQPNSTEEARNRLVQTINRVVDFCAAHPRVTVQSHMNYSISAVSQYQTVLLLGYCMQVAYRGSTLENLVSNEWRIFLLRKGVQFRYGRSLEQLNVPNYEIWPPNLEFDEEAYRKDFGLSTGIFRWFVQGFPGGLDGIVAEVRRWYAKGILSES